jgi:2-hydroxycyclohexanecarboxyl-CoA dehydrogenase
MELGLKSKVVLVTGGGQGVGRRICLTLAAEGARVVVNDLAADRAERVAGEIGEAGGKACAIAADITDLDAVRTMVADAGTTLGLIDVLVNNAGIIPERRSGEVGLPIFPDSEPAHWTKIVDLNMYGTMNCSYAVLPGMIKARSGRIVSMISDAGRIGEARYAVYGGAKAGVLGFTRSLAKEVGKFCINVNAVSLAAVSHEVPMADFLGEDATAENNETLAKMLRAYPLGQGLGRLTKPEDAANAVAFLASDAAAYVTGQCLSVNGGYAMI